MAFVEIAVQGTVTTFGLSVALTYAAMQSRVLLVNNAEDLDEDEREGTLDRRSSLGGAGAASVGRNNRRHQPMARSPAVEDRPRA
jgi:1,4-dihydroxy-2-naphthoate octaprenyltransferase